MYMYKFEIKTIYNSFLEKSNLTEEERKKIMKKKIMVNTYKVF